MKKTPQTTFQITEEGNYVRATCRNQTCEWTSESHKVNRPILRERMARHAADHRTGVVADRFDLWMARKAENPETVLIDGDEVVR